MYHVHSASLVRAFARTSILLVLLVVLFTVSASAQQTPASESASNVITCVSKQNERQVCKADTSAGVALLRSTGDSACLLGKNWGYDDAGVWVSNGCGGEFAIGGTREASGASEFVGLFEPYGQLRTHFAAFKDDLEVQDNATRIGINFATRGKIKVIAGTEWGVNLVRSENQFNLSGAGPADEFGDLGTTTTPVFLARLGFVGVDFGPVGKVTIGKQYAPHYDIAGYTTDRFNVFGGQGTFAYTAGADGGETGTGRADRAVQYRNTIAKILEVGLQGQFRAAGNDMTTDGVGGSAQIRILPGVKIGTTYTRTNWAPAIQQRILGLGGNADYWAVGSRIDWRMLELGVVYAHQHNGDIVHVPVNTAGDLASVAFDANGFELYARAGVKKFGLIGGYTYQDPTIRNSLVNPDFRTRYFILGAEWFFAKNGKIYSESRLDSDSVTATGDEGYNVFTIGFRYDFSFRLSHRP